MRLSASAAFAASLLLVGSAVSPALAQNPAPAPGTLSPMPGGAMPNAGPGAANVPQPSGDTRTLEDFERSHLALAQDLVNLTDSDQIFDNILPRIAMQTQEVFTRSNPSLTREIEDTVTEVALEMARRRVDLSQTIQVIWARRFTEEELAELKTFFSSDLGRKFVEATPIISALSVGAAREWEQALSADMVNLTRARLTEQGQL